METRPRENPFERLAEALQGTAHTLRTGLTQEQVFASMDRVRTRDPRKVSDALKVISPPGAKLLLVVDQFEELFTTVADESMREQYLDCLLGLTAEGSDAEPRVVLTMRRDYYNLCAEHPRFYEATQQNKVTIRRMTDEQLTRCITEPLKLAGVTDSQIFAETVVRDLGDEAGELALLETALEETWRRRNEFDGDLLKTYQHLGEVTGILANLADDIYQNKLSAKERTLCPEVFIELVQLGDTGGMTRYVASRSEFSDEQWELLQKLSTEDYRRLVVIGGDAPDETAEIAHEALITQWARYQKWVQEAIRKHDKRRQDQLRTRAKRWAGDGAGSRSVYLASGGELRQLKAVAPNNRLTRRYLAASHRWRWSIRAIAAVIITGVGLVTWFVADAGRRYGIGYAVGYHELVEPETIALDGGEFVMGSPEDDPDGNWGERPTRTITIRGFGIGKDEVTFKQYDQFALLTGRELPNDQGWGRSDRPVINVSWPDATAYAEWLSSQIETDNPYRLPTEAEWEYAARAGTEGRYWWCPEFESNCEMKLEIANCADCGSEWDKEQTAPVGSFDYNPFGLHDTAGNVWEWTQDCWHGDYRGAPKDGSAWREENDGDCALRVMRGGSLNYFPGFLRSATRVGHFRDDRLSYLGFRLAQDK